MKRYLKPGMTFVDVGANIGSHTVHGARLVMPEGKVFSFEADPDTFKLLAANLRLNGVVNTILFNQCVSDKCGPVVFNVNANSARSSLLRPGSSQISLSASTLDRLLPPGLQVDLLKIDVEGGDYLVLKGARKIFESRPPRVVVIEATSCKTEIKDFLLSYGYRLYQFDDTISALVQLKSPVFDTYAVRDDARREIACVGFQSAQV
jgi:FkbM family methyltransferase